MLNRRQNETSVATYGIMLLVFVTVGRIQELIPYLDKIHFGKLVFGLCIVLAIAESRFQSNFLVGNVQIKCVVGIFVCAIVSVPFSYWPGGSFEYLTKIFLKTLIAFFLIITVVKSLPEIQKIVWALTFSVFALSFSALILGGSGRISSSSTYDPNDLAFVLVTFMPIIYYFMKESVGCAKLALLGTLSMMLLALVATGSRGGVVGLIFVITVILLKNREKIVKAISQLIILLVFVGVFAPTAFWDRMSTMVDPQHDYNITASGGRIEIWKKGINMMVSNPLTGVGINCFEVAEGASHTDEVTGNSGKWSSPHNSFIQIGAELGVVALVLFIKLLISSIKSIRTIRKCNDMSKTPAWLLDGIEVSIYGYISTGVFLSQAYSTILFLLVGMTVVVIRLNTSTS